LDTTKNSDSLGFEIVLEGGAVSENLAAVILDIEKFLNKVKVNPKAEDPSTDDIEKGYKNLSKTEQTIVLNVLQSINRKTVERKYKVAKGLEKDDLGWDMV